MTATDHATSTASATQPIPVTNKGGRPRKHPEGYRAHMQAVRLANQAQQAAQLATVAATSQSLTPAMPQTVQKPTVQTVRPLPPSLQTLSPYPTNEAVLITMSEGDFNLTDLGQSHAHATGFLSALLETGTHRKAFAATGMCWPHLHVFEGWCSGFGCLYRAILAKLDAQRVRVLRDEAYEWANSDKRRNIYHDGKIIDSEALHSDKMHDLLLRGLDPETFGKASEDGTSQAVQVNITL